MVTLYGAYAVQGGQQIRRTPDQGEADLPVAEAGGPKADLTV